MPVVPGTVSLPLNGFGRAACSSGRFARRTMIGREMSWTTENNQSSTRWTRFQIWKSAIQLQLVLLTELVFSNFWFCLCAIILPVSRQRGGASDLSLSIMSVLSLQRTHRNLTTYCFLSQCSSATVSQHSRVHWDHQRCAVKNDPYSLNCSKNTTFHDGVTEYEAVFLPGYQQCSSKQAQVFMLSEQK